MKWEGIALKDSELRLELQVLRKRSSQLPQLFEKLKVVQTENLKLRRRNDALARKAFNRLTQDVSKRNNQESVTGDK